MKVKGCLKRCWHPRCLEAKTAHARVVEILEEAKEANRDSADFGRAAKRTSGQTSQACSVKLCVLLVMDNPMTKTGARLSIVHVLVSPCSTVYAFS